MYSFCCCFNVSKSVYLSILHEQGICCSAVGAQYAAGKGEFEILKKSYYNNVLPAVDRSVRDGRVAAPTRYPWWVASSRPLCAVTRLSVLVFPYRRQQQQHYTYEFIDFGSIFMFFVWILLWSIRNLQHYTQLVILSIHIHVLIVHSYRNFQN